MSQPSEWSKKRVTIALLWGAMLSSFVIRYALGVVAPTLMATYDISPKAMGYILSGWNWTNTAPQLLIGPIVDRFGVWISFGIGSAVWTLSTIALPIGTTVVALFVMRAIFGLGQSLLFPGIVASVSQWFTVKERARAIAVVFSASQLGLVVGAPIAAFILARMGWQAVFYWIGGGSLLTTIAWFWLYPEKRITYSSRNTNRGERIAWRTLLRHRSTWGIAFGHMGYLYAFFFFVSWFPTYLVMERNMTVLRSGIIGALPFLVGMLGTLGGGWLGDYMIKRGISTTVSRKSILGTGLIGATVLVVAAAFARETWLAVTLLTVSVGSLRLVTASGNAISIDLAPPSLVGSLASIQNFFGNIGGLLAPIVTGYILQSTGSFVGALVAAGGMALFGALSYLFLVGKLETYTLEPGIISAGTLVLTPNRQTVARPS
jgi:MFS transporter, ACS family, D-galactonate transporter